MDRTDLVLYKGKRTKLFLSIERDVISARVSGEPNAGTLLSVVLACDVENLENDKATGKTV